MLLSEAAGRLSMFGDGSDVVGCRELCDRAAMSVSATGLDGSPSGACDVLSSVGVTSRELDRVGGSLPAAIVGLTDLQYVAARLRGLVDAFELLVGSSDLAACWVWSYVSSHKAKAGCLAGRDPVDGSSFVVFGCHMLPRTVAAQAIAQWVALDVEFTDLATK